jgi:hypothetical protein
MCFCVSPSANTNSSDNDAKLSNVRIEIKDDSFTEFTGGYNTSSMVARYFNGAGAWNVTPSTGIPTNQSVSSFVDCVAFFNGSILTTSWIGSSSSYKIKKEIEELNDNECLNKLLLLKPCKYRYIDDNKNFDPVKKVYGFIAEEVKEVLPEAIDDTTEQLIPNIYKLGKIEYDILTIEAELEINIEYTVYLKNGEDLENATKELIKEVEKIDSTTATTYRVNKTFEGIKDVFVYGKIEQKFNSLKKEYLHNLTISSVQKLYRIIQQQQQTISNLESRLTKLEMGTVYRGSIDFLYILLLDGSETKEEFL